MSKGISKYPQLMNKECLHHQYWVLEDSLSEIGEDIGCDAQTVLNWMRHHGIPTRDYHECHRGHFNANYKQGEKFEGEKNPFYGKHHTEEAKEESRKAHIGKKSPFKGKALLEDTIKILTTIRNSKAFKRKRNATIQSKEYKEKMEKKWNSDEYRQQMRDIGAHGTPKTHHTKPELIFGDICKKHNIPFHYVGNKQLWIGDRHKLNPDFIEANGKKICVEIMGDYWHSPLINFHVKENRTLPYREKHYKKYGWIPIFIWESDTKRLDAEQFILNLLTKEGVIK